MQLNGQCLFLLINCVNYELNGYCTTWQRCHDNPPSKQENVIRHHAVLGLQVTWSCKLTGSCCLPCSCQRSWFFQMSWSWVLDIRSALDIWEIISNGISWIPSNCVSNGDFLSHEALVYAMHKTWQSIGRYQTYNALCDVVS